MNTTVVHGYGRIGNVVTATNVSFIINTTDGAIKAYNMNVNSSTVTVYVEHNTTAMVIENNLMMNDARFVIYANVRSIDCFIRKGGIVSGAYSSIVFDEFGRHTAMFKQDKNCVSVEWISGATTSGNRFLRTDFALKLHAISREIAKIALEFARNAETLYKMPKIRKQKLQKNA